MTFKSIAARIGVGGLVLWLIVADSIPVYDYHHWKQKAEDALKERDLMAARLKDCQNERGPR